MGGGGGGVSTHRPSYIYRYSGKTFKMHYDIGGGGGIGVVHIGLHISTDIVEKPSRGIMIWGGGIGVVHIGLHISTDIVEKPSRCIMI